jgi:hypothetical protein
MRILKFTRFSHSKIAQAITSIVTYILDFYINGRVLHLKPFEGSHTKLRASQKEDFRKNRAFQIAVFRKKSLKE